MSIITNTVPATSAADITLGNESAVASRLSFALVGALDWLVLCRVPMLRHVLA